MVSEAADWRRPSSSHQRQIMTVTGPALHDHRLRSVTDAHTHLWIDPVAGQAPGSPVLNSWEPILGELQAYKALGGGAVVDCQPGGCGRNAQKLVALSHASGVRIIACTGFYLRRSYHPEYWLWQAGAEEIERAFMRELTDSVDETRACDHGESVRAGLIKVACESTLAATPRVALEGAAAAAAATGSALEIHTEKGEDAEAIAAFFIQRGVQAEQMVICHIDKRPDFGLHKELTRAGVLLEYDTFYRPKYSPETGVWPLLESMVAAGLDYGVALATDMADIDMWRHEGASAGLVGMVTTIRARMHALGFTQETIDRLSGGNITDRLAGLF
jgi:5-phospho-D-xylono-1,4-lactonase